MPIEFEIQTERMTVRTIRPADRDAWIGAFLRVREVFGQWFPDVLTPDEIAALFDAEAARARDEDAETTTAVRLIGVLPGGTVAGYFSLTQIFRRAFQNASAGWSVHPDLINRGYATEGVNAMLDVAFAPRPRGLGLHRVQANIIPHNAASLRVAEKTGFRREGLALRYLRIGGKWQDHVLCAKLADEHREVYGE
jgi:ribosomal-protein-alanine N-acetyltransferase